MLFPLLTSDIMMKFMKETNNKFKMKRFMKTCYKCGADVKVAKCIKEGVELNCLKCPKCKEEYFTSSEFKRVLIV